MMSEIGANLRVELPLAGVSTPMILMLAVAFAPCIASTMLEVGGRVEETGTLEAELVASRGAAEVATERIAKEEIRPKENFIFFLLCWLLSWF
jgi:hypothetical protein